MAKVQSVRRTDLLASRKPSNACGDVTSCTRCLSMYNTTLKWEDKIERVQLEKKSLVECSEVYSRSIWMLVSLVAVKDFLVQRSRFCYRHDESRILLTIGMVRDCEGEGVSCRGMNKDDSALYIFYHDLSSCACL